MQHCITKLTFQYTILNNKGFKDLLNRASDYVSGHPLSMLYVPLKWECHYLAIKQPNHLCIKLITHSSIFYYEYDSYYIFTSLLSCSHNAYHVLARNYTHTQLMHTLTHTYLRRMPPRTDALRHSGCDNLLLTSSTVTLYFCVELNSERRPGTRQKVSDP